MALPAATRSLSHSEIAGPFFHPSVNASFETAPKGQEAKPYPSQNRDWLTSLGVQNIKLSPDPDPKAMKGEGMFALKGTFELNHG